MEDLQLVSIFLVAGLTVLGNILYFQFKFKKEEDKDLLNKKLTNLLLPLYIGLKEDDLKFHQWSNSEDTDLYEYEAGKPRRLLVRLSVIIQKNLYLADSELHSACLYFLEWAYRENSDKRYDRLHHGPIKEDKYLEDFKNLVYLKYSETKSKYLGET